MTKRLMFIAAAAMLLSILCSAPFAIERYRKSVMSGPLHTFQLDDAPAFLTESLALEKAREALDLDGLNSDRWNAEEDGRSTAPDGTQDIYLSRNTLNPNSASVLFVSVPDRHRRAVRVELHGSEVQCQVWRLK